MNSNIKRIGSPLVVVGVAVFVALFACHEYLLNAAPDYLVARIILKAAMSAILAGVAWAQFAACKTALSRGIAIGLTICAAADVGMSINLTVGALLFMAGHATFIVAFIKECRPSRRAIAIWIVVAAALAVVCIFAPAGPRVSSVLRIAGCVYMFFVVGMLVMSHGVGGRIFIGGATFFASDALIVVQLIVGQTTLIHIVSLGVYYIACLIMATGSKR